MGLISLNFVDYVVKIYVMTFLPFHLLMTSPSIGCVLSAPDGTSPRGYVWILVVKHRLKILVFSLLLTSTVLKPPSPSRGFYTVCPQSLLLVFLLWYYRLLCAEF
jgi:hypothetical protein